MSNDPVFPIKHKGATLYGPLEPEDNERARAVGPHTRVGTLVKLMGGGPILTVSGIAQPTAERRDYALETVWINEAGEVKSLVAPFACFALYGPQYD